MTLVGSPSMTVYRRGSAVASGDPVRTVARVPGCPSPTLSIPELAPQQWTLGSAGAPPSAAGT
jgi:hypothetical protein